MEQPSPNSGHIDFTIDAGIGHISINRPEAKNALSLAMYADMVACLQYCREDASVRVLCLSGQGGQFSSGNDLKDFLSQASPTLKTGPVRQFVDAVISFDKPLLAAVEGVAYGIGTTVLMHCDFVASHPQATYCLPFVKLGLVPEFGACQMLASIVGQARAREWLLGGEPFSAEVAFEAGLLSALVDKPFEHMLKQAGRWAALPPTAVKATKALLKRFSDGGLDEVVEAEIAAFSQALVGPEFKEAATAFFEKRAAKFD